MFDFESHDKRMNGEGNIDSDIFLDVFWMLWYCCVTFASVVLH